MTDIHEVLAGPVRKIGSKQVLFSVKIELIFFPKNAYFDMSLGSLHSIFHAGNGFYLYFKKTAIFSLEKLPNF